MGDQFSLSIKKHAAARQYNDKFFYLHDLGQRLHRVDIALEKSRVDVDTETFAWYRMTE
jgi:hypothetical protein